MNPTEVCVVIPCFNEAGRLSADCVSELIAGGVDVILVDDGSTDGTGECIEAICAGQKDRVHAIRMIRNVGKAEAVRRGMNHAHALGASVTGYLDADFATPAAEMLRLIGRLRASEGVSVVLASRWLHLGAQIRRSSFRHYAGRVFATFASIALRMPVYDTQCGAKVFRVTDAFLAAIDDPFYSRWAFDVELLGRLRMGLGQAPGYALAEFVEEPLQQWSDIHGSKITLVDMVRATLELIPIGFALRRSR